MKTKNRLIDDITSIIYLFAILLVIIGINYYLYIISFNKGVDIATNKIKSNYQSILDGYTIESNSKGLFNETINGIMVYSDKNNFTRINSVIKRVNITSNEYNLLSGIIYYQNKSDEITGYYEHIQDMSCDGSYYTLGNYIVLWRCDGSLHIRNLTASENNSEEVILLHELGHYKIYTDSDYIEKIADEYAKEKMR